MTKCNVCNGTGKIKTIMTDEIIRCPRCKGEGMLTDGSIKDKLLKTEYLLSCLKTTTTAMGIKVKNTQDSISRMHDNRVAPVMYTEETLLSLLSYVNSAYTTLSLVNKILFDLMDAIKELEDKYEGS